MIGVDPATFFGPSPLLFPKLALLLLLVVWSLYWKGRALWRAAKNDNRNWFIALLIVNTLGILEILYLHMWGKEKTTEPTAHSPRI